MDQAIKSICRRRSCAISVPVINYFLGVASCYLNQNGRRVNLYTKIIVPTLGGISHPGINDSSGPLFYMLLFNSTTGLSFRSIDYSDKGWNMLPQSSFISNSHSHREWSICLFDDLQMDVFVRRKLYVSWNHGIVCRLMNQLRNISKWHFLYAPRLITTMQLRNAWIYPLKNTRHMGLQVLI